MQTLNRPTVPHHAIAAPARWLPRLLLGGALNIVAWVSAWARIGPLAHHSFFPLWLGCILLIDAIAEARTGASLWRRSVRGFVALFIVSTPFWWYFERLNRRVGNWHYRTDHPYGAAAYILWASLAFSTVIPAVLCMTELIRSFAPPAPERRAQPRLSKRAATSISVIGVITLVLSLVFPLQCFPFLWLSLLLILDPINSAAGESSIIGMARARSFGAIGRLMAAGLLCGLLWEMWNSWSLPQWYYTVPYVGFGKVFAMPVLGYGGYLPFALEIFAVYHFARLLLRRLRVFPPDYVRI